MTSARIDERVNLSAGTGTLLGVARQGYVPLGVCLAIALVLWALDFQTAALAPTALASAIAFFFRDPERRSPNGADLVLSPADGKVIGIDSGVANDLFPRASKRVSIFMSPLNVHINRSPISGCVVKIQHKNGKFRPAFRAEAARENEQNAILIQDDKNRMVLFVQVAGALARRIVCHLKQGDMVHQGDRVGMIVLGSRVDVYVTEEVQLKAVLGEFVRAGETVIGHYQ